MDWESKFSSIVRETESNLEKVKRRLGAARASSNLALGLNSSITSNLLSYDKPFRMDSYPKSADTSYHSNGVSYKSFYHSPALKSSVIGEQTFDTTIGSNGLLAVGRDETLPLESSPGVILVLQEKLEAQAKAIESLAKTVHRLTEEKDLYYKQMRVLRDEVTLLKSRVIEKGVDLQTERKLQLWKQEMMSEMQMLQHQINMQKTRKDETLSNSLYDGHASSLIKEMQDLAFAKSQTLSCPRIITCHEVCRKETNRIRIFQHSAKNRKQPSTSSMKTTGNGHDTKLKSHDSDLDLSDADLGDLDLQSTEFSLSSKDQLRKTLDTEDELELLDTADLNLSSDGLSTDGDTLDLDELK